MNNPYPESVFPPMDLKEASEALAKSGISPDRVFGNWGREVWNNCHKATLQEVGEWLEGKTYLTEEGSFLTALGIYHEFQKTFLQDRMPEEVKKSESYPRARDKMLADHEG